MQRDTGVNQVLPPAAEETHPWLKQAMLGLLKAEPGGPGSAALKQSLIG